MLGRTRWKLVAWSAGSTLVVLVLLGSGLYAAIAQQLRAESEDRLQRRATVMAQRIPVVAQALPTGAVDRLFQGSAGCAAAAPEPGSDGGGTISSPPPAPVSASPAPSGDPGAPPTNSGTNPCPLVFSVSVGPGRDVQWSLPATIVDDPALPGVLVGGPGSGTIAMVSASFQPADASSVRGFLELDVMGIPMRVLTSTVEVGGQAIQLQVAQDRTVEVDTLQTTLVVLVVGGAGAVLAASGLGYRYAGRALVPIRDSLRHQREFAADASHELRTPLSVIRSNVQALRGRPRDADDGQMLDDIDAEAERMARLVDQLLLLARTDSGSQEVDIREVDLGQEAADAMDPLARVADAREVVLELDVAPAPMEGDPTRLRQLVSILVDNAIRHAPDQGHVWVHVGTTPQHATLTVDDDGPGVRPDDRERVFDRFWRAPDAPPGGSGLGLAIAAWIVDRHGGTIGVSDRPGGGARFQVRLPAS